MGLYDTLTCDYPLPDPELQQEEFQTKDLECALDRYRISTEGRLLRLSRKVDLFVKDRHPPSAAEPAEDMNYRGDLSFYTRTAKGWIEYRARFTHGYLDWILRPGEPEPADTLERLVRDAGRLEQERATRLEILLQRLESLDPEVAKEAVFVFGDRAEAARWLNSRPLALARRSPYEELARGHRKEILNELGAILYGNPL